MPALEVATRSGRVVALDQKAVRAFGETLDGQLIQPGDAAYDDARQIWNAMIDRRPALIARCASSRDVQRAVAFARESDAVLAVRGGGHNIAGNAVCDGGLVVDLSAMKRVDVDPGARRARVGPGATLGDFDAAAQRHGLATPLGINSTTGVAGLTLGGGFGWLTRQYGMTVDNLTSADVVTADGEVAHASPDEHADLFWAIRGGGGNFGVVTNFEFALHPVGPEVFSGLVVFPLAQGRRVLEGFRDLTSSLAEDTNVWAVMRKAPPLPFLPESAHGSEIVALALFSTAGAEAGERLAAQVRGFGSPLGEHVGMQPYAAWQQAFDPLLTPGARNYWKSHNFRELGDGVIEQALTFASRLPSPQCEIFIALVGGQAARPAPDATAYAHRDANYVMNVHGRWETAAEDRPGVAWAREFFDATAPYAAGSVYVNFMTEDEGARVGSAYGPNLPRLKDVKRRYDPDNVFRLNQNIDPRA
ncbi:MAG TPA: FAD-binding oxidoreductase [Dehalococcoidia bacterium]|nr:FAD-binding oxidoreductase [Dehalococcoidia bacterium]